jgi:hypothetical protein
VKVLLDECVDWRLARDIVGHDVRTAREMGWTTVENGQLLACRGSVRRIRHGRSKSLASTEPGSLLYCSRCPSSKDKPACGSETIDAATALGHRIGVPWRGATRRTNDGLNPIAAPRFAASERDQQHVKALRRLTQIELLSDMFWNRRVPLCITS